MVAVEKTGTSSEVKEEYEKYEKFEEVFFIPPPKGKIKAMKKK
jgi:hypothetical protein